VTTSNPVQLPTLTPNAAVPFLTVAETPEYIVINKPAGVIVHQSDNHPTPDTLANGLIARYPELVGIGEDALRPGMMHRLDQGASGIMVIARTQAMYEHLKRQFQEHTMQKQYAVLVHGKFSQPTGEVRLNIARSAKDYTKMAARPNGTGKPAVTKYEVITQYQRYTLLSVDIETGRTHQIRVHMSAIDHPVVGEQVYLPRHFKSRLQPGRLFLHAKKLTFTDQNGETVSYTAPLPPELQSILDGF